MQLIFKKNSKGVFPAQGRNLVCLHIDNWDDFGFKSLFYLTVFDENGINVKIGNVKIGYKGQSEGRTETELPAEFGGLGDGFFSLGQDPEYYQNIVENLSPEFAKQLLKDLRDLVYDNDCLLVAEPEDVFKTSLLRGVSISVIRDQFKRILNGQALLTEFHFSYNRAETNDYSGIDLDFHIKPDDKPSTNIHVIIGRNGAGKTTLLDNIVRAIIDKEKSREEVGQVFNELDSWNSYNNQIDDDYFSSIVSIAFSAFDPFTPPADQPDRSKGTCFFYIGLKKIVQNNKVSTTVIKDHSKLKQEFTNSLGVCFSLERKKERWIRAIRKLESDTNFKEMDLNCLTEIDQQDNLKTIAGKLFSRMSSGHAIVLLSITKLVETVEEKTLVLIDEPESHLHPPLLSAFTRALSDLLIDRNGVAIIATHSPVVLQEVPKLCVWKLFRSGLVGKTERPESETFGENVGTLTREVFGLEVFKSGFHELLEESVLEGGDYESIIAEYNHQLGFEGKAILRALIANRNNQEGAINESD